MIQLDKKFWATALTLSGTMIGAGILGLPYAFSKSGFASGIFWLVFLGLIMIYINLCLAEITLRTKKLHQIPGYAEIYLGKWGKNLMLFAVFFGIYAALLAYLIGEGQSLSKLFFGTFEYSAYFAVGFWIVMTLLLRDGLEGLKKIESRNVLMIIFLISFSFIFFLRNIKLENLAYHDFGNFFFPFGIVLFALLGFSSIPEMRVEILKKEKFFKKAVIIGTLIPISLYAVFSMTFLGSFGKEVTQVATLSFGNFVPVLGVFTMFASYFVLSFSLNNVFERDMKNKDGAFFFVSVIPLALYFLSSFFKSLNFASILGIGGVVSGGLTIILILLMQMKAKKHGDRKPEFSVPMNWILFGILSLVFALGVLTEVF